MSDGSSRFNLFTVPSVNVLGYRSLGLEILTFCRRTKAAVRSVST